MGRRFKVIWSICIVLVGIAACRSTDENQLPTAATEAAASAAVIEPTQAATLLPPTNTLTPEPSASHAPTLTRTVIWETATPLPTPNLLAAPLAQDLLFAGDEGCTLPCWYGLRVGESSVEEIEQALRYAFGFSDDYVFRQDVIYSNGDEYHYLTVTWLADPTAPEVKRVYVSAQFDPASDTLQRIWIDADYPALMHQVSPQRLLRELGAPAEVWIYLAQTEIVQIGVLDGWFINPDAGVSIRFKSRIQIRTTGSGNTFRSIGQWCLNGAQWQDELLFWMYINPIPESEKRDDFLKAWRNGLGNEYYVPLEDVFGITPQQLYEQASQVNNACIDSLPF
jgi:hypothetical protein